jgi:hypothetical protein
MTCTFDVRGAHVEKQGFLVQGEETVIIAQDAQHDA